MSSIAHVGLFVIFKDVLLAVRKVSVSFFYSRHESMNWEKNMQIVWYWRRLAAAALALLLVYRRCLQIVLSCLPVCHNSSLGHHTFTLKAVFLLFMVSVDPPSSASSTTCSSPTTADMETSLSCEMSAWTQRQNIRTTSPLFLHCLH